MTEFFTGYAVFNWIATWANPFCDVFFRAVTDLGYHTFYYLSIAPLFWVVDRRRAVVLFLLLILSAYANTYGKLVADIPRPDPNLARVIDMRPYQSGSKSFPSGHAQNALVFWGYLALWARRRWSTIGAAILITLISFSRLYLGVHFPVDIVGGLVIGAALMSVVPLLDRWAAADFNAGAAARSLLVAAPAALIFATSDVVLVSISGSLLGVAVALWWLPQRRLELTGRLQGAMCVIAGLALQIALTQTLGSISFAAATPMMGARVAVLWIVALWLYPVMVGAVVARRPAAVVSGPG